MGQETSPANTIQPPTYNIAKSSTTKHTASDLSIHVNASDVVPPKSAPSFGGNQLQPGIHALGFDHTQRPSVCAQCNNTPPAGIVGNRIVTAPLSHLRIQLGHPQRATPPVVMQLLPGGESQSGELGTTSTLGGNCPMVPEGSYKSRTVFLGHSSLGLLHWPVVIHLVSKGSP